MAGVDVVAEDRVVGYHVEDKMNLAQVGVARQVEITNPQSVLWRVLVDQISG